MREQFNHMWITRASVLNSFILIKLAHLHFSFQLVYFGIGPQYLDLCLERLDLIVQLLGQCRLQAEQFIGLSRSSTMLGKTQADQRVFIMWHDMCIKVTQLKPLYE